MADPRALSCKSEYSNPCKEVTGSYFTVDFPSPLVNEGGVTAETHYFLIFSLIDKASTLRQEISECTPNLNMEFMAPVSKLGDLNLSGVGITYLFSFKQ